MPNSTPMLLDLDYRDLLPVFDGLGEGVIIVDTAGTIIYYNGAMAAIDELTPADTLFKKVIEVYDLSDETSIIMQCLKSRQPIVDRPLIYRTRMGKIANTIHTAVNCAAIPENLLEGILFGTTPGAFTGARNKPGLFERASGGTIFLDELNSMALGLQAKILRVIQEYKVRRLGSIKEVEIDLKIISTVNKEPHVAIAERSLRSDLFYRLGVVFIPIPPLRQRPGDIALLTRHFLKKHSRALNKKVREVSAEVQELFLTHHWPGNVRDLEHFIEGALNLA